MLFPQLVVSSILTLTIDRHKCCCQYIRVPCLLNSISSRVCRRSGCLVCNVGRFLCRFGYLYKIGRKKVMTNVGEVRKDVDIFFKCAGADGWRLSGVQALARHWRRSIELRYQTTRITYANERASLKSRIVVIFQRGSSLHITQSCNVRQQLFDRSKTVVSWRRL
jgi:hypothetical protein